MLALLLAVMLCPSQEAPSARVGAEAGGPIARGEDAVVMRVGDVELRRSDVFRMLDLAAPERSGEVLRRMVLTTAAELDAREHGIDVAAAELEQRIEQALAEQRAAFALEIDETVPMEEYLERRHGLNAQAFREEVRRMVLGWMLLERAVRLDQRRAERDILQVLVVDDEALAGELSGQLRGGASFSVLAKRHSMHPSAGQGGDLPPMPADLASPLVEGRASLAPGELLGPEPITLGGRRFWRIVRLVERLAPDPRPWSEQRAEIEAELLIRPVVADELSVFEARAADRYRVSRPP